MLETGHSRLTSIPFSVGKRCGTRQEIRFAVGSLDELRDHGISLNEFFIDQKTLSTTNNLGLVDNRGLESP